MTLQTCFQEKEREATVKEKANQKEKYIVTSSRYNPSRIEQLFLPLFSYSYVVELNSAQLIETGSKCNQPY